MQTCQRIIVGFCIGAFFLFWVIFGVFALLAMYACNKWESLWKKH